MSDTQASPVGDRSAGLTRRAATLLLLASCAGAAAPVIASTTYSFYGITNNHAANTATGEAQLFVDVTDPAGANNVLFTFRNTGPHASSIADIYFDDGTLLGIASIAGSPGVSFSQGAAPPNLPGGNLISPPFNVTAGFLADSDPPVQPNGVNPGEWVAILFNLQSGGEVADVVTQLASGALRIGLHVQGFANGGSESFVHEPPLGGPGPAAIPESSRALMLLAGLGTLVFAVRRRVGIRGLA